MLKEHLTREICQRKSGRVKGLYMILLSRDEMGGGIILMY